MWHEQVSSPASPRSEHVFEWGLISDDIVRVDVSSCGHRFTPMFE